MSVNVKFFGPMIDVTGKETEQLDVGNTNDLKKVISLMYPDSSGINYSISVNQEVIDSDTEINENDEVAILPPFAGG